MGALRKAAAPLRLHEQRPQLPQVLPGALPGESLRGRAGPGGLRRRPGPDRHGEPLSDHPGRRPGNSPLGGPDGERGRGTPGRKPGPFAQAAQGALRDGDAARDEGTDLRSPEQLLLPPRIPFEHPLRSRPDGSHPLRVSEGRQGLGRQSLRGGRGRRRCAGLLRRPGARRLCGRSEEGRRFGESRLPGTGRERDTPR